MITVNGKTIPNIEYYFTNVNEIIYPKSGSDSRFILPYTHSGSGSADSSGNFSLNLYPADYNIQFGIRNRASQYYKDLSSGSDNTIVSFGGNKTYLIEEEWI